MWNKLDYFRVPTVQHYLIVRSRRREVIHYQRAGDGIVLKLRLDNLCDGVLEQERTTVARERWRALETELRDPLGTLPQIKATSPSFREDSQTDVGSSGFQSTYRRPAMVR